MKVSTRNIIVVLAVIIFAIILIYDNRTTKTKLRDYSNIIASLNDSLIKTTNAKNQETTRANVLEISNIKILKELVSKDSNIVKMQKLLKQYETANRNLQQLIIIKNSTIASYQDSLVNIISSSDTVIKDSVTYIYPTYYKDINMFSHWITGDIKLGRSTSEINIKVDNEYQVAVFQERKNIFSKYNTFAEVTNLNPYSKTRTLKVYSERPVEKRKYAVGVFAGQAIIGSTKQVIGIGVMYNIITF